MARSGRSKLIIGVDLGGTKMLTVLFDGKFNILAKNKVRGEASKGKAQFFDSLKGSVERVTKDAGVTKSAVAAIGVGCAGMISFPTGVVGLSPNIPFLKSFPLQAEIQKRYKVPTLVENDVNSGLYGEYRFGPAADAKHVVGIFPGTGVGGAIILNGQMYRGATGVAGEIGHIFMRLDGMIHGGNTNGTLEALVGRIAIASEAAKLAAKGKAPVLESIAGSDVSKIKSKALLKSIQGGDTEVEELILHKADILGLAMANMANILNPELIVLGGGVIEAMESIILPRAKATMKQYAMKPNVKGVKVIASKLGDYAVAQGAAALVVDEKLRGRRR